MVAGSGTGRGVVSAIAHFESPIKYVQSSVRHPIIPAIMIIRWIGILSQSNHLEGLLHLKP
jgi:hypothetical protein